MDLREPLQPRWSGFLVQSCSVTTGATRPASLSGLQCEALKVGLSRMFGPFCTFLRGKFSERINFALEAIESGLASVCSARASIWGLCPGFVGCNLSD